MNFQERRNLRRKRKLKKRLASFAILLLGIIIGAVFGLSSNKSLVYISENTNKPVYNDGQELLSDLPSFEDTEKEDGTKENIKSVSNNSQKIIVIDAGHQKFGNSQQEPVAPNSSQTKAKVASGTIGVVTKNPEYAVTLDVSILLKQELQRLGYSVIMIRETNEVDISNSERAIIANNANADAFIRIHCNGVGDSSVKGALSMCQTAKNPYCGNLYEKSRKLSECVLTGLCQETGAKNRGVSETDSMSGINWCKVPVTIVEMGFMSNPEEDRLLSDKNYQAKLAKGMAKGIDEYFK